MSHRKVTVELNESLYEMLAWISSVTNTHIEKLLILAAYEKYNSEEIESSKMKQESLIGDIDNWLDRIREGTATDEDFNLAKESSTKLLKEIEEIRLRIKGKIPFFD
ncbi:hypothetical protein J7I80_14435 [Bacillus sp. ISL-41]|uniref:hypothetical protein n=1 Tax=Bacillus sp. ISL-41 TaxID=2819127 RepID=UPI001BE6A75C|nr:hypothetical protein [Bacillus sp. ISL-41]MBT2643436.1 hypothetical protein [Bacillus sp. ISL-41]